MSDFSVPMPPRSSLKRSQKPIRARKKAERVVGKLGIVRLKGAALEDLRHACWLRDLGNCQNCRAFTFWKPRFDGDPVGYDMAHIKSRGAGGSDTLENVRCLCHSCHMKEHTKGLKDGI